MNKYNQKWVAILFRKSPWAVTLGQTTYYTESREAVSAAWQRHEDEHKAQWQRDGKTIFAIKYLWYQIRYGYKKNPYETEAVNASDETL